MCDIGQICEQYVIRKSVAMAIWRKYWTDQRQPMPFYLWFTANVEPESELNMQTNRIMISIPATWFYWEIHIRSQWSVSTACCVVSWLLGKESAASSKHLLSFLYSLSWLFITLFEVFTSRVRSVTPPGGWPPGPNLQPRLNGWDIECSLLLFTAIYLLCMLTWQWLYILICRAVAL